MFDPYVVRDMCRAVVGLLYMMLALALQTQILHAVSFVFGVERDYVNADVEIFVA